MKISLTTAAVCALLLPCGKAPAQSPPLVNTNTPAPVQTGPHILRMYPLRYASSQAEQNEILTAVRNIVTPQLRIFLVPTRDEIAVSGSPEDLKTVEELLAKLDVPQKLYRLTYTFTESDGGKRIGVARYTMTLAAGQRMQMKHGSRVPLTVTKGPQAADPGRQIAYIDVGLNFDSEVKEYGAGVRLKSKVEQSSVADEKISPTSDDPVIRQTTLEGVSTLTEGRPVSLGEIDIVGSTRHLQVEALIEAVK